jgi:hypothetical protein
VGLADVDRTPAVVPFQRRSELVGLDGGGMFGFGHEKL